MTGYFTKFLQKAYELINPNYARNGRYARDKRMARFKELKESGRLEGICGSEIEAMFGITRISEEF